MKKLGYLLAGWLISLMVVAHFVYKAGLREGVDNMHKVCYDISGVHFGSDGTAVICGPLTKLPPEEAKKFLPNS